MKDQLYNQRYKEGIYRIESNRRIGRRTWLMRLSGDTSYLERPGQFVNIRLEGKYLRRPISVCDYDKDGITLLYDVVGEGTEMMSRLEPSTELNLLTGLGNGFWIEEKPERQLLVGGGIGIAPLLNLCRVLVEAGVKPVAVLGFNTAEDVVMTHEFEEAGAEVVVTTADGTYGKKGFVTDAIKELGLENDYFYSCGPLPMLKALCMEMKGDGQLSFDSRMACGFGVCMCCSLMTKDGSRRICADGPIFRKEDLIWK